MTSFKLVALAALVAASTTVHAQTPAPTPSPAPKPTPAKPSKAASRPAFTEVTQVVTAAHEDAVKRLGDKARAATIELLTADNATWPDSSLGCPVKGMNYTDALVPGYRVRLRINGEMWDYHASKRGGLVLCPISRAKTPLPSNRD
ncbi:hypothetical protein [Caenimonas koreensis]|uniref:Uncharacterized protein n=1 Tax=Caenimonas koreensis DSM 17982 TaxID=1121255 RepID=A0A844AUT3_9BURK|nr:hypothetical protein [Caenimonas koreensis]MRD46148.1 hypothetical protein [Caenimonas koreensis DSM 17982]